MTRRVIAIASSSELAAQAGARMAAEGGNAVDAAIAASLVQLVTEPGVVSLGGGALITIWPGEDEPIMIDAASEMPGRGLPEDAFGRAGLSVILDYGGGTPTCVGYGSVATPGALAGLSLAASRFGRLPWAVLVEPAYEHARDGFPMPEASHNYLVHTHPGIFGWNPAAGSALLDASGAAKRAGERVRVEHLDTTLRAIADEGVAVFYRGEIGTRIARDMAEHGGILTRADLSAYRAQVRPALNIELDAWHIATSPPPSVGGPALVAMLQLMRGRPRGAWTPDEVRHLAEVQEAVLRFRIDHLDESDTLDEDARRLLELAGAGQLALREPASTVHTSSVDADGLGCSVTASAGYGSGVMPPGTGVWMNNSLGEAELNRRGFHAWRPGTRIISNMAPTLARRDDGALLAIGSPGADRITTAILQVMVGFAHLGLPLEQAVAAPRLHVEFTPEGARVAHESALPVERIEHPTRLFEGRHMFFGGVAAALLQPPGGFEAAADPRRTGGIAITGDDEESD